MLHPECCACSGRTSVRNRHSQLVTDSAQPGVHSSPATHPAVDLQPPLQKTLRCSATESVRLRIGSVPNALGGTLGMYIGIFRRVSGAWGNLLAYPVHDASISWSIAQVDRDAVFPVPGDAHTIPAGYHRYTDKVNHVNTRPTSNGITPSESQE